MYLTILGTAVLETTFLIYQYVNYKHKVSRTISYYKNGVMKQAWGGLAGSTLQEMEALQVAYDELLCKRLADIHMSTVYSTVLGSFTIPSVAVTVRTIWDYIQRDKDNDNGYKYILSSFTYIPMKNIHIDGSKLCITEGQTLRCSPLLSIDKLSGMSKEEILKHLEQGKHDGFDSTPKELTSNAALEESAEPAPAGSITFTGHEEL